ncbi:MAG: prealbumin-like fold domain-containing protein [Defluviitaleaceae bacterium]|nr:prealbumin-like fold domain-containing protein [Defluviitaleaceae bacterium]
MAGQFVEVTNFQLTVNGQSIDTIHNMMMVKILVEYKGSPLGIFAGDKIVIELDNSVNEVFGIIGFGRNVINIHGDGDIGVVGTRTYRNDQNGNYYLEVEFDQGYYNYFKGEMPDNIKGWLETSVYVLYKRWVQEPIATLMTIVINGVTIHKNINVEIGGGPLPERLDTPGPIIGKSGRYGAYSGNLGDLPEVEFNDYLNFEPIRWNLQVGYQNLTWRDLRGTGGDSYYTTDDSLEYSNSNPRGERYQSNDESYLMPYAKQLGYPIDAPFHNEDCVLEDYLVMGPFDGKICSSHEYVKDSLRIIRVMGREVNTSWWGKDAFRVLADSNFLKYDPNEPIDRYLNELIFEGYRGLTINEFLEQMHLEGQFLDKYTADDILSFAHVNNGEAPGTPDPDDTNQIPYFKLLLGNMHFNSSTAQTVNLIGFDNSTVFEDIPAKNLPYAYLVYYDTKAIEAVFNHDGFHYNNSASFKFSDEIRTAFSIDLWIKLEDGSGGSGNTTEVRIKKLNENGLPLANIEFTLTQTNILPPHIRRAYTTINGTASFTLRAGEYTLSEEDTSGKYEALAPMNFTVRDTDMDELFNLRRALEGTGYKDWDKLGYLNGVNIITNRDADPPDPPDPDICKVIPSVIMSIAKQETALACILKAEASKLRDIIRRDGVTYEELMEANRSLIQFIDAATRFEMVLYAKLNALPIKKCLHKKDQDTEE